MEQRPASSNIPIFSVSELAFSLKKTIEGNYAYIRVRGELSKVKIHTSGHMYSALKDDNACIDAVCWKTVLPRLSVKPEEGLEVICTGRVSTFPARSNYQLIIESMELAGEGALLRMLEERKKRLAAEGLFNPLNKKRIPFLPDVIGVITSPTGAVIRDIMHRIEDRFPRRVLLWPVQVQGEGAAAQIEAAVRGFSSLSGDYRPDVLIIARGGGSLEDLMPFNEENVVRAVAECSVPVISAIGHETDTTLVDYAADLRAPTPTGAAEMAVPRRIDLLYTVRGHAENLLRAAMQLHAAREAKSENLALRLGDPLRMLENRDQRVDHIAHKLSAGFERFLYLKSDKAGRLGARLRHPEDRLREGQDRLKYLIERLGKAPERMLADQSLKLSSLTRMLGSLSYENVLQRGFVVVRDESGGVVVDADKVRAGQKLKLEFRGRKVIGAVAGE